MTEDDAKGWIVERFGRGAADRVGEFLTRVVEENERQNLISPASIPTIWSRHAVDSAQLVTLAPDGWATWLDIGTGGGFPGMVVALLAPDRHVVLTEPRGRRAAFLSDCVDRLGLARARVHPRKVETARATADVISARAVASIEKLLRAAAHCSTTATTWLLPRGQSGAEDLVRAGEMFHVEHSITDTAAVILVGHGVGT